MCVTVLNGVRSLVPIEQRKIKRNTTQQHIKQYSGGWEKKPTPNREVEGEQTKDKKRDSTQSVLPSLKRAHLRSQRPAWDVANVTERDIE